MESTKDFVPKFFNRTAKTYDKIVNITTFGKDRYWKKVILNKMPRCHTILDLACGTGILTFQIAEKIPEAKIIGVDITKSYLDMAKNKLEPHHKISFLLQDAENLNLTETFDCITSSYIPKYCKPEILIPVCIKHLKPGGKIIFHDFTYPKNKLVRILWNVYFVLLHFAGFFIPSWNQVFVNLPQLIRSSRWLDEYEKIMLMNGLQVEKQELTYNTSAVLTGTKKI